MITLYTMNGTAALESFSPFCMKVEVYLKLQKLPYQAKSADPRKTKKGKLPTIDDDGTKIADSSLILEYLEKKAEHPLDAGLDAVSRAQAHVLKRMFEESLYFVLLWSRWGDDAGWEELRTHVEPLVPAAVRWFVPGLIRKKVVASSVAQGTGRHTRDEIYALGTADLEAVAAILGARPYLLGEQLRTIDVIAYAFLANILLWSKPSPLTVAAQRLPVLEAYVKRIAARVKDAQSAKAA